MTVVLCIVFSKLQQQPIRTFAPTLLSGLTFWGFITAVVMQGCQCFFTGESYIRQYPAPLAIHPLRTTLGAGFHFLLGLGIAIAFVWGVHGFGNVPALISLVPTLALLFVIGWSLALLMGIANVMFQDSQHLIEVVLQVAFYGTPIIYPAEMLRTCNLGWIVDFNPLAALLELIQQPLLQGRLPSLWAVGMSSLVGALVVGMAAWSMQRIEKRMIFYL
jgi:lipopolysaccharide transport system permease protein